MTEKRYYQRDFEELYYIIDSHKISEKEFDEKEMYDGYSAFEDSMTGEEIVDLLNENEQLKQQLDNNLQFLIRASERLGFESLDHLLYTLDKGEITGYSTANWGKGDVE
jgi:hypothetical protein